MKIATSQEMHQIDFDAITKYGIPEIVLMENAGNEIAKYAIEKYGENIKVCILAGYGNNGGDALVAARHLINIGAKCKIFFLGNRVKEDYKPSALMNYNILEAMDAEIYHIVTERDWNRFELALTFSDLVIDGLLGTGVTGELSDIAYKTIDMLNSSKLPVLSIDIPSGINADTGDLSPIAVKATTTITFGIPKLGMFMVNTKSYMGEVITKNIGIPNQLLASNDLKANAVDQNFVNHNMASRPYNAHKGQCGKVLVLGSSIGYTGASRLAATAALRVGAGLVNLGVAKSIYPIMAVSSMETMVHPLPEDAPGVLGKNSIDTVNKLMEQADIVVLGPGLGRHESTLDFVLEIVKNSDKPLLLDADAIYALRNNKELLVSRKATTILTPHLGELATFIDKPISEIRDNLFTEGKNLAETTNSIVVIKSEQTITFYPNGELYVNTTGNPGMATAGSGDVLAGTIAGLFAEALCGNHPVPIGVYLHGLAGDISAQNGAAGLIASDLVANLQKARHTIKE